MTGSDKYGTKRHSPAPRVDPTAMLALARTQAAASSSSTNSTSSRPAPPVAALGEAPDSSNKQTPLQVLQGLVLDSENVKPLMNLLTSIASSSGPRQTKRSREMESAGTPVRTTTKNSARVATFNKKYSPGEVRGSVVQVRIEVAKVDTLQQILENIELYTELGVDLEKRRELVEEEMKETGRAVLRDLRNKYQWLSWGSRWELACLVKHAFPDQTSLDCAEQALAFLECSDMTTVNNVIASLKIYVEEFTTEDVPIEAEFELLCKLAKINEFVTALTPRFGLDKEMDPEWVDGGSWRNGFRHGPPQAPFYQLLTTRLKAQDWKKLIRRFSPLLRDWFEGKGDQRASTYDVEANPMHIWHWDETHSPLTEFSNACFGPTPEGHSILIKRARDDGVLGPYFRYTVDKENKAVGGPKKGGPELFLEAIKEVSSDGKIPLFAYSTTFIDELILIAAAYHAGALVMEGKIVTKVPKKESLKNKNGGFLLEYMLHGSLHTATLLNIGRVVIAANSTYLKQKSVTAASWFAYRLSIPGQEEMKIPGIEAHDIKPANFASALSKKANTKEGKCSLDIFHENIITLDFKSMYTHYTNPSTRSETSSPPSPKRPRLSLTSAHSQGSEASASSDEEESGQDERNDELATVDEEHEGMDLADGLDDGAISEETWRGFEARWNAIRSKHGVWIKAGKPGTRKSSD